LRFNFVRRSRKVSFVNWRNEKATWAINERKWRKNEKFEKQVYAKVNVFNLSYWEGKSIAWVKNARKRGAFELAFSGNRNQRQ